MVGHEVPKSAKTVALTMATVMSKFAGSPHSFISLCIRANKSHTQEGIVAHLLQSFAFFSKWNLSRITAGFLFTHFPRFFWFELVLSPLLVFRFSKKLAKFSTVHEHFCHFISFLPNFGFIFVIFPKVGQIEFFFFY